MTTPATNAKKQSKRKSLFGVTNAKTYSPSPKTTDRLNKSVCVQANLESPEHKSRIVGSRSHKTITQSDQKNNQQKRSQQYSPKKSQLVPTPVPRKPRTQVLQYSRLLKGLPKWDLISANSTPKPRQKHHDSNVWPRQLPIPKTQPETQNRAPKSAKKGPHKRQKHVKNTIQTHFREEAPKKTAK